jgi:hypothetical protein
VARRRGFGRGLSQDLIGPLRFPFLAHQRRRVPVVRLILPAVDVSAAHTYALSRLVLANHADRRFADLRRKYLLCLAYSVDSFSHSGASGKAGAVQFEQKTACQSNQPGSIVTASRETLRAGKVTVHNSQRGRCWSISQSFDVVCHSSFEFRNSGMRLGIYKCIEHHCATMRAHIVGCAFAFLSLYALHETRPRRIAH